jgi:hypothetical protein
MVDLLGRQRSGGVSAELTRLVRLRQRVGRRRVPAVTSARTGPGVMIPKDLWVEAGGGCRSDRGARSTGARLRILRSRFCRLSAGSVPSSSRSSSGCPVCGRGTGRRIGREPVADRVGDDHHPVIPPRPSDLAFDEWSSYDIRSSATGNSDPAALHKDQLSWSVRTSRLDGISVARSRRTTAGRQRFDSVRCKSVVECRTCCAPCGAREPAISGPYERGETSASIVGGRLHRVAARDGGRLRRRR